MNSDFNLGKKEGRYFAISVDLSSNHISDSDLNKILESKKSNEYKQGFKKSWKKYWNDKLMSQC